MDDEQEILPSTVRAGGKPVVLVVDDDKSHRKLLELLAERLQITAHLTASCDEALAALQSGTFDVILMDCRMPGTDGFKCTEKIRSLSAGTARLAIVAVTGQVAVTDKQKCIDAGMDDFLAKPFTLEELHEKITYWLQVKE